MYVCMHECVHACVRACVNVCVHVRMCVLTQAYFCGSRSYSAVAYSNATRALQPCKACSVAPQQTTRFAKRSLSRRKRATPNHANGTPNARPTYFFNTGRSASTRCPSITRMMKHVPGRLSSFAQAPHFTLKAFPETLPLPFQSPRKCGVLRAFPNLFRVEMWEGHKTQIVLRAFRIIARSRRFVSHRGPRRATKHESIMLCCASRPAARNGT